MKIKLDKEITKNPKMTLDNLGFLYFLYKDDALIYIGSSVNPYSRIRNHNIGFTHFQIYECPLDQMYNMEAQLIVKYLPPKNKSLPGNDLYKTKNNLSCAQLSDKQLQKALQSLAPIKIGGIHYYSVKKFDFI